jgi:hypothetical protein
MRIERLIEALRALPPEPPGHVATTERFFARDENMIRHLAMSIANDTPVRLSFSGGEKKPLRMVIGTVTRMERVGKREFFVEVEQ